MNDAFTDIPDYVDTPSDSIDVFYILGDRPKDGLTQDLGKFFSSGDAAKHVDRFHAWHNVRVETRREKLSAQHPAHRGVGSVEAPTRVERRR